MGALGSSEVFEVDHRLPCTGDAERVRIGLGEAVDVVHAAVEILDPGDAVLVESLEITRFVERYHLLDSQFLGIVLRILESLLEPINDVFEGFSIKATHLIDTLHNLAVFVLDELRVETDPHGFRAVIFVRCIPCLRLGLGYSFSVVIAGRVSHEIDAILGGRTLRHNRRIKHDREDSRVVGHTCFSTSVYEPLLTELRHELILGIVMVNAVGEPDTFKVFLEE